MLHKFCVFFLALTSFSSFAQIKGVIRDSKTKEPIPYVNISVQGEKTFALSADENGNFTLPKDIKQESDIYLSAVGYANASLTISAIKDIIFLQPQPIELNEVVIGIKKGEHTHVINPIKKAKNTWTGHAGGNSGILMMASYIPYKPEYDNTPYLDKIQFKLETHKENTFNMRLYNVNDDGSPGDYLYDKNILVTVKPNQKIAVVDFSKSTIRIPENGLFVVMEIITIKQNRLGSSDDDKLPAHLYAYGPGFVCEITDEPRGWWYKEGKWQQNPKLEKGYGKIIVEITLTD
ncbi:carboxypeptidase-like regulatory domain-containing protein [Flavobacterium hauense]